MSVDSKKFVIFDTFGTVVNWHGSVVEEGRALGKKYGVEIDWPKFVNEWRDDGYIKAIFETAKGIRPWEPVDQIHRKKLEELLAAYNFTSLSAEDMVYFNLVWHRLKPWPDAVAGLTELKQNYAIGPFSNGDFRLILDMAKNAGLPWDFIATADLFKKFKPDPQIYLDAAKLLDARPSEIVMVAAHLFDLDGAKTAGFTTVFVPRPLEYGHNSDHVEPEGVHAPDYIVNSFTEIPALLANIV